MDLNNPWLADGAEDLSASSVMTMDQFNYTEYADRYPDVKEAFGYDKEALYMHYILYGINEGRIATVN